MLFFMCPPSTTHQQRRCHGTGCLDRAVQTSATWPGVIDRRQ